MTKVGEILALPKSEVFITFMSRDINRFLDEPNHQKALAELMAIPYEEILNLVTDINLSNRRDQRLREEYELRLKTVGGASFTWSFRVAVDGASDTIYYLIHGSNHIKAFREMKDATHRESSHGNFSFLGKDDFASKSQQSLIDIDQQQLAHALLRYFAGRDITFVDLVNQAYPAQEFYRFVEKDFRTALLDLIKINVVQKIPVTTRGQRGLNGNDRLRFPEVALLPQSPSDTQSVTPKQLSLFG